MTTPQDVVRTATERPARPDGRPTRVRSVGLIIATPARLFGLEPFFVELVAGLEDFFAGRHISLLLNVVPDLDDELRTYRRWHDGDEVAGVILVNLHNDDVRPGLLNELGMPWVVIAESGIPVEGSAVRIDSSAAMREAVRVFHEAGHRRIAHITGPMDLLHIAMRAEALKEECRALGISQRTLVADYTEVTAVKQTARLLTSVNPPTAIIYDNDIMALGSAREAVRLGFDVPGNVSLLAWDDSTLCRLAPAPMSAMSHDVFAMGALAAECLLTTMDTGVRVSRTAPTPVLVARRTMGAARTR